MTSQSLQMIVAHTNYQTCIKGNKSKVYRHSRQKWKNKRFLDKKKNIHINRQKDRQTARQADSQAGRQTDRQPASQAVGVPASPARPWPAAQAGSCHCGSRSGRRTAAEPWGKQSFLYQMLFLFLVCF